MKRSNNFTRTMYGNLQSRNDTFNKIIIKNILPNMKNLTNENYSNIKTFIENGQFYNIINIIKKFKTLPSSKLALEAMTFIKKGFDQNDEINYFKNIKYLEILANTEKNENINVNLVVDAMISTKYMIYMSMYGFPEDGIFKEDLLELISKTFDSLL
jgi:hypothetical protein